ncbi:MAG: DUF4340 domain-containing protein [Verrucomicrobiota bacterium]
MNRKQLTVLIVLVALVGGAGWVFLKRQHNAYMPSSVKMGAKLFPKLPINDVARIHVKDSASELNLVKKDDLWRVEERGDYPANFSQISGFLLKAADLKIGQSEEIGASQFARLELLDPSKGKDSGTLLEFKGAGDKTIQSAILGKKQIKKSDRPSQFGEEGFPIGRYVLLPTDTKNAFLVSDALSDIEPKPENWLNKDFFKIEKVKSISLVSTNATNSWKLSRTNEASGWVLADVKPGEELDTNKVSGVANSLASPSFVDVLVNGKPEQMGLDKPTVATLETFDGFNYTLNLGTVTNENYPLNLKVSANFPKERVAETDEKPEQKVKLDKEFADKNKTWEEKLKQEKALEKWTYLVAKWTIDPLLRDRAQLMIEKKDASKKADPTAIDPTIDPTASDK